MRRRALLGAGAGLAAAVVVGPELLPDVRLTYGVGKLHAASERYVAGGLEPGGDRSGVVRVVGNVAPSAVGPDAPDDVASLLREPQEDDDLGSDLFHLVVETRVPRDDPFGVVPGPAVERDGPLSFRVAAERSPYDDLEPELRDVDELVYTAVWTFGPAGWLAPTDATVVVYGEGDRAVDRLST